MASDFSTFDSIDLLTRCNATYFGFETFTPEFFRILGVGFQTYHGSHFKKTGLAPEKMTPRQCFDAIVGFRRRQNDVKYLTQSSSWKTFSACAQHNAVLEQQLLETEERFRHEARFTTHSNESLIDAYEKLLELEKLLALAKQDLAKAKRRWIFGRIPAVILENYETYLNEQWDKLQQERNDIVTNMLSRLIQVAYDPLLKNSDTLPSIIEDLKAKGFLKERYTAPKISDDALTKENFLLFHRIIETHEWEQEINKEENIRGMMHQLPWFKQQSSLAKRFKVEHLIPTQKRKPEKLFWHANFRFEWFNDFHAHAKIDAALHYLKRQRTKEALTFESLSHRMVVLHSAEQALGEITQRIWAARKDCLQGWRKFFSKNTFIFLDKIESKLQEQAVSIVTEKIRLLSFVTIASIEEIQSLRLFDFVKTIEQNITALEKVLTPEHLLPLRKELARQMKTVKKTITAYYQTHLKNYFFLWTEMPYKANLTSRDLDEIHIKAMDLEKLLLEILPPEWALKIQFMQRLRQTNQLRCLENAARLNLTELLDSNPSVVQHHIKKELGFIQKTLITFIQTKIKGFNYESQKNILAKILEILAREECTAAENSTQLTDSQKGFLQKFPEINFYLNVTLRIKYDEKILSKLLNPTEIEERLSSLYRFIEKEEGRFIPQHKAKFIVLFAQSDIVTERKANINQLKRGIV